MHSFHPSRGRILFEVSCALAISASCVGAWLQTGASALLAAALVASLCALTHAFDMRRPRLAAQPNEPAMNAAGQSDPPAYIETVEPTPVVEDVFELEATLVDETLPSVTVEEKPKPARKAKRPSRKKKPAPEPVIELLRAESAHEALLEASEPLEIAEEHHAPIAPLFEPQPLVRQQRAVFGRKAG